MAVPFFASKAQLVRNVSVLRRTSRSLGLYRRFRRSSRSTSPCLDDASQIPEHTAGPQPLVRINSSPLYVAPTALSDMCGPGYFDSQFTFELTVLPQLSSPLSTLR